MKAIYKRRLLKLAKLLREDAKNKKGVKFDLGVVTKTGYGEEAKIDCGTYACAMGLAALSGAFYRDGVRWKDEKDGTHIDMWIKVGNKRYYRFDQVAMRLFGIHEYESDWLFTPDAYLTHEGKVAEREVARRIERFVAGKEFAPLEDGMGNNLIGRFPPSWA